MAERLPSLDLLLNLVRAERDLQQRHFDALDSKAGIVLAFSGLLVTLVPDLRGWVMIAGAAAAAIAAGLALSAFFPRPTGYLQPFPMRKYLAAEENFTRLTVHDTLARMVTQTSRDLQRKGRRLRFALIALLAAAATFAGGIVEAGLRGEPDDGARAGAESGAEDS